MDYSTLTDAELRAALATNPDNGLARAVALARFCDTTKLDELSKTVEIAKSLTALLENRIADVSTCLEDIRDYLQRAIK